jgi:UDP-N-acetyl-D-glucosamine dehydrogenase
MEFLEKINDKTAKVGIIGLGYVGLPLGLEFALKGFDVIGFDVDKTKIPLLMEGKSYIKHISEDKIKKAVDSGHFTAVNDFADCPKLTQLLYVSQPL